MIWQLIKRDPAWRWVPILATVLAMCGVIHGLRSVPLWARDAVINGVVAATLYGAVFLAGQQRDDTPLQSTLPLTARRVFLSRLIAMFALLWLPGLCWAAAFAAQGGHLSIGLLSIWSVYPVMIACIQCAAVRGLAIPERALAAGLMGVALALSPALVGDLIDGYLASGIWLIGVVVLVRTWRSLPISFQIAPLKLPHARAEGRLESEVNSAKNPWLPVWRGLLGWRGWSAPALAIWMALQASQISLLMMMFVAGDWLHARTRAPWLSVLPVPRRTLLAVLCLPTVLALAAGYEIGIHLPSFPSAYERGVMLRASQELPEWHLIGSASRNCKTLNVLPSLEFWVPVRAGHVPPIQSPWGETFQPSSYRASGFDVYNPYAVGCGNSERFLDWQLNRATAVIYGEAMGRDHDGDFSAGNWHAVPAGLRTQLVSLAAILGYSMVAILLTLLNDWYRFRRLGPVVRRTIYLICGGVFVWLFVQDISRNVVFTQWLSWTLPASVVGAMAVALPVLGGLYLAIDFVAREVEFVDKPATRAA